MKHFLTTLGILIGIAAPSSITARFMQPWTYQDLFAKSDFVVVAMPAAATHDTAEHSTLRDIQPNEPVVGVVTEFRTLLVLKGSPKDRFVLHHYRLEDPTPAINGPELVAFDPAKDHRPYLLFLVREPDGRFAPTGGQTDPAFLSVQQLPEPVGE